MPTKQEHIKGILNTAVNTSALRPSSFETNIWLAQQRLSELMQNPHGAESAQQKVQRSSELIESVADETQVSLQSILNGEQVVNVAPLATDDEIDAMGKQCVSEVVEKYMGESQTVIADLLQEATDDLKEDASSQEMIRRYPEEEQPKRIVSIFLYCEIVESPKYQNWMQKMKEKTLR